MNDEVGQVGADALRKLADWALARRMPWKHNRHDSVNAWRQTAVNALATGEVVSSPAKPT